MVDIQTLSIAIASAGVFAAAIYYILQLRHQSKVRQTDLLVRLYSTLASKDWLEAYIKVRDIETADLSKLRAEHAEVEFNEVLLFFDELGVLLQMGLVDIRTVEKLLHAHIKRTWEKTKPMVVAVRKSLNDPRIGEGFEYLYNEMKKREQQPAKTQ
jgi:hypothetical protein